MYANPVSIWGVCIYAISSDMGFVLTGRRLYMLSNENGKMSLNRTTDHRAQVNARGTFFKNSLAARTKTITRLAVMLMFST